MRKRAKVRKSFIRMLLLMAVLLGGCSPTGNDVYKKQETEETKETERSDMSKRIPTEEQLEILKDAGMLESERQELQKEGMPLSTQSFVDTAQMMLTYLEEKYGQEFRVSGGSIPGALGGGYSIRAYATEGERAYEDFDVEYVTKGVKEPYYQDGYFALIKELEVQEYLQELVDEAGLEMKVIVSISGLEGKHANQETKVEEMKTLKYITVRARAYVLSGMSDMEFDRQTEAYEQLLADTQIHIKCFVYRVADESYERMHTHADFDKVFPSGMDEEVYTRRYYNELNWKEK